MKSREQNIRNWIKEHKDLGIKLLQRLVQEDSTRGNENKAQAIIIEKCRQLGMELDIWELGEVKLINNEYFCCDRKDFSGNPNVVALLKGTGGGKSIILNGHIDVVPEGDRNDWKDDPYSGNIKDGKLYGRGSTDMKGGTVSLLLALEAIIALNIKVKGDIIFQSVIEEESGGAGTLSAALRGYRADGAIIPEPTNMKLFPKQQGSMWFRITVKGKSAHGGTRYEGVNAVEKAIKVVTALQQLEKRRNERILDPLYKNIPIPIPINIGKVNSGSWPSSVPDVAIIEGRMGVAPNETMKNAEKEMEECLFSLKEIDSWFSEYPPAIEWFGGRWLPGDLEQDHELMKIIRNSYIQVINKEPVIEASPWGTDGGILSVVGNTPVVIFGPGKTEAAHEANEYIELEEMIRAAEIIALVIINWCEADNSST
ncbi:peptidase [Bacillus aquiflavi]|uniref:Peptidase n=1 Tax=Bacillus aquiflavi TaxID=2672567 RepID=A0A6B3W286_9BACI|nr:peptidase [Bacillus aquiflavi]MBA4537760.1 peptidase [Bacillus aquiflavi]NEY82016.1 peptidase [Bacillus aquiflavi]UAC46944.1 peptidase [Bacillus aquiflavi]